MIICGGAAVLRSLCVLGHGRAPAPCSVSRLDVVINRCRSVTVRLGSR